MLTCDADKEEQQKKEQKRASCKISTNFIVTSSMSTQPFCLGVELSIELSEQE